MDEIKEEELEAFKADQGQDGDSLPYAKGDRIGRKGLEKTYESHFRGRDGVRYIKVNAFGKEMDVIEDMPQIRPLPGTTWSPPWTWACRPWPIPCWGTRSGGRWSPSIPATAKCW